eukprot:COSAG02_NODE_40874_length_400_cov_1.093023_2_plen_70_part_01
MLAAYPLSICGRGNDAGLGFGLFRILNAEPNGQRTQTTRSSHCTCAAPGFAFQGGGGVAEVPTQGSSQHV